MFNITFNDSKVAFPLTSKLELIVVEPLIFKNDKIVVLLLIVLPLTFKLPYIDVLFEIDKFNPILTLLSKTELPET